MEVELFYDRGTILIRGDISIPFAIWDDRTSCYRSPAFRYRDIVGYLRRSGISFRDRVLDLIPSGIYHFEASLRDYQVNAYRSWVKSGRRGVVVLPTGSGKTFIALKAIYELQAPTLIVVPTLPLVEQWFGMVKRYLNVEPGVYGGGKHVLGSITVSTYDSAYIRAEELGNKFLLVVFDEAHHVAAEGYIQIAEMLAAPYRLGLTATFEREDGRHIHLFRVLGGVVYRLGPEDLKGRHLADFKVVRIPVSLAEEEKDRYEQLVRTYKKLLKEAGITIRSIDDFRRLIVRSGASKTARRALLAWNEARKIAINSESKIDVLKSLLEAHRDEKVIIFTEFNSMAERVSRRFLIPLITQKTGKAERKAILEGFRTGEFTKIVTSKVLDEGLDVPDASVAIILGGTGSKREFIQRLGRILRKKRGKQAILYEVVSSGTAETRISWRRRRAIEFHGGGEGPFIAHRGGSHASVPPTEG